MEIVWDENPLKCSVILTEDEKEDLYVKYVIDDYDEDEIKKYKKDTYKDDSFFVGLIEDLNGALHVGDCVALPIGCRKCYIEDLLGITTLPPNKRIGHWIYRYFMIEGATLNSVLEKLSVDQKEAAGEKAEDLEMTLNWLTKYKDEHFLENDAS